MLVCAPTGAGKTVVGEFAVHLALAEGRKCFYTTPIKALSNQKYADLVERHGPAAVGLLTGDTPSTATRQVVVMTTEVLRNMIYAGSRQLADLGFVVMDEVHYLADRFRGAVWEEVILQLPERVALVSLSATVSNAEEFGDWLVTVRGDTAVVVDEHRPVPLWQHMMVGSRLFDSSASPTTADGELVVDPVLVRQTDDVERQSAVWDRGRGRGPGRRDTRFRPPSRVTVIDRLDRDGLLPAITFVFSRAGCDAAVGQCVRAGLRLTTDDEVAEIRATIERRTAGLPQADLGVLGYWEWREALERGIAAHHAGLLPAFKETVEELFVRGLVRAVFATETLALGINMPARTVVLERLVKFNGESHAELTPGRVHPAHRAGRTARDRRRGPRRRDLAARRRPRAGRRAGLHPHLPAAQLVPARLQHGGQPRRPARRGRGAGAAGAVVRRSSRPTARSSGWPGGSSATARPSPGTRRRCTATSATSPSTRPAPPRLRAGEGAGPPGDRRQPRGRGRRSLRGLKPGDVIAVPVGRRAGLAVVLDPGIAGDADPRPLVLTEDRWAGRLSTADFPVPVEALGRMRLPKRVDHRVPRVRRDLASALRSTGIVAPAPGGGAATAGRRGARTRSWPRCGGPCAPTPATAAPTGRRTPAGPSGTPGWTGRPSSCARRSVPPPTRWPARSTGSGPLLGERGYLDGETVTAARRAAGPAVGRVRPARRRVPPARHLGRARPGRPGCRRVRAGLRVAPRRRAGAAGAAGAPCPRRSPPPSACGRGWRPTSAVTAWSAPASPTSASRGRCTGGPEASRWPPC